MRVDASAAPIPCAVRCRNVTSRMTGIQLATAITDPGHHRLAMNRRRSSNIAGMMTCNCSSDDSDQLLSEHEWTYLLRVTQSGQLGAFELPTTVESMIQAK